MKGKNIVILGGGESGVGAALLAKKHKAEVFLSDLGKIKKEFVESLEANNIEFESGGHTLKKILKADLVIKSPGIPEESVIVRKIREAEIKIISEIEFGYRLYDGKIIAITGSNGKTTTSGLIYHIMEKSGINAMLGGNYGESFCRQLVDNNPEWAVLEISSFQLDDIKKFRPRIAVLLNISPDHLDRYSNDFKRYVDAKFRIVENQKKSDLFIYNKNDEKIKERIKKGKYKQEKIKVKYSNYKKGISSKEGKFDLKLKGEHNLFNAFCAISVARELGIKEKQIQKTLLSFENVPHRLESLGEIKNVEFINDSKATNVDATYYALKAMKKDVIWIAGGIDKGNNYEQLFPLIKKKVKALICLGVNHEKLIHTFMGRVDVIRTCDNMEDCVRKAYSYAIPGEVVLLAPACSSFDLFKNYKDRGDQFRNSVKEMNSE